MCKTNKNSNCFNRFHADDFHLVDSLGLRGKGPNEFSFPHISHYSSGIYYVIDNGNNKSYLISKDSIIQLQTKSSDTQYHSLKNFPKLMDYPIIGHVEHFRSNKIWKKQNILTGEILDSLCIEGIDGSTVNNDFSWYYSGDKVVIGFLNQSQFAIETPNNKSGMLWTYFTGHTQKNIITLMLFVVRNASICFLRNR